MKKIALIIILVSLISCKKEIPVDYAIVSGKIMNAPAKELKVYDANNEKLAPVTITNQGTFTDTLYVNNGFYTFSDGENRINLYLEPGNNLIINYDATQFENSLSISGIGSEIANYLITKEKTEKEMMGEGTSVYLLEEDAYKNRFAEIKSTLDNLITLTEGISEEFKTSEKKNINYSYLEKLARYESYHSHYADKPDFKVSNTFLKDLDGILYDNEDDFLFSSNYKSLITSHFYKKAGELAEKDSISEDIAFLKTVSSLVKNETIKNSLLFDNAKYGITYTEDIELFYTLFSENSTNEKHKKEIAASYTLLKKVGKGQPSPKFSDYENHKGGVTSLDDLKGKFVYIDVWATWCGPCKAEIPALKEIEKKYHGKNIEFVSISVDKAKDHEIWKKMVSDEKLGGIQLFADKDWDSEFVQEYLIKGIPRFILVDPNGTIVNSNAPRPSDEKLIELFKELKI
ncbi:redoxin family protein [Lutibacter sp.]|uniref:TlpA family protein disulfide reductase n=1 Tax=Lutibacter sp. TaxID=1925666 RepID=UPI0027374F2E|nr:thioredoxin-like domain-containing protein [Lutibacter sp.]MDP3312248.1 redoxin family protein [Lutibacter sp.]